MFARTLSLVGLVSAVTCLYWATVRYEPGFDWNRHFISTLLRSEGDSRGFATAGVLLFCASMAAAFWRIANSPLFSGIKRLVQIGGVGTMVYASFTPTPLHDVVVSVSLAFYLASVLPMLHALVRQRMWGLAVTGALGFAVMALSAYLYYSSLYTVLLPWGQRIAFGLFAIWVSMLDWRGWAQVIAKRPVPTS